MPPTPPTALPLQFHLWPNAAPSTDVSSPTLPGRPTRVPGAVGRSRAWDDPVLLFLGRSLLATSRQIADRFFGYRGAGGRYAYQVIRDLERMGLVAQAPVFKWKGRTSPTYCWLTPVGWARAGQVPSREFTRALHNRTYRDYRLQLTEVLVDREVDGWVWHTEDTLFDPLRQAALRRYKKALSSSAAQDRGFLERARPVPLPFPGLVHAKTHRVRLVVPAREGYRATRGLEELKKIGVSGLLHPFTFEVVGADPGQVDVTRTDIVRWAKDHKLEVQVEVHPPFSLRANPATTPATGTDRYQATAVGSVQRLITGPCSLHTP